MRRGAIGIALALASLSPAAWAQEGTPPPPPEASFDELWQAYQSASGATARKAAFDEIAQLRSQRNIRNLDGIGAALVARGREQLDAGEDADAATALRFAVELAPELPDAHLALGRAEDGLGMLAALEAVLPTWQGRSRLIAVALGSLALGLTAAVAALGLVYLIRYGALLLHDLRENSSAAVEALAPGLFVLVLLLPLVLFQGWGWLPLWWMGVLFVYMTAGERITVVVALAVLVGLGPLLQSLERRQWVEGNPLFWSALRTVDGGAQAADGRALSQARDAHPEDRDLTYLLALHHRKAGRPEAAERLYGSLLAVQPGDPVALNNLANIEFLNGDTAAAIARYEQVSQSSAPARVRATAFYNLSIAKRFQFDYGGADELRRQADALARGTTAHYEQLWSYQQDSTTLASVVDVAPTREELWAKLVGTVEGVGRENLTGTRASGGAALSPASFANRIAAFGVVMLVAWLAVRFWRGSNLLTVRCMKCGTAISRRSRIGAAAGGLCTQCYHLYVVKDGISGPARRQKLAEVQGEETRRGWVFRLLSLVSPGAGHVFAERTLAGFAMMAVWYVLLAYAALQLGPLPLLDAPSELVGDAPLVPALVGAALVFVIANALKPALEKPLPVVAHRPRRAA